MAALGKHGFCRADFFCRGLYISLFLCYNLFHKVKQ